MKPTLGSFEPGDLLRSSFVLELKDENSTCIFFQSLRYVSWVSELLWKVDRMGFFFKIYYCLLFWLWWAFTAAHRVSPAAASRGYSVLCSMHFSSCWLLLLQSTGSRHVGFGCCSAQAQLLCGLWDLPGPGIEPVSSALPGRFLTTRPTGREGSGTPLQYSCLENPMDGGAW